jgi:hypothetical protein
MMASIRLVRLPEAAPAGPAATVTLRFGMETSEPRVLEAILYARRSMLREEWTRGREADEPFLEDALFSSGEVVWQVEVGQRNWCLQKLDELMARARRWLTEQERSLAN